jgi:hypothetical protein
MEYLESLFSKPWLMENIHTGERHQSHREGINHFSYFVASCVVFVLFLMPNHSAARAIFDFDAQKGFCTHVIRKPENTLPFPSWLEEWSNHLFCGSLLASAESNHNADACDNVTAAGNIGSNQTGCGASYNPTILLETIGPVGGTGAFEYQWQVSPDNASWTDIGGATAISYDPPAISTTQYFRRGVRRATCTIYLYSNSVQVAVYQAVIQLGTPTVSSCINQPLQDIATVTVSVSWSNAFAADTIEVRIYGQTERINVATGVASPQSVTFNVPANGATNQTITAAWRNNPNACTVTALFSAPTACSNDVLNCNILYLCGQDKPQDGPSWDHGFMTYLDANNGAKGVVPILTKADVTGMGTYHVLSPSTFVTVNLDNYDLIIISATTENHISTDLVNALKQFTGSVLNANYLLINDLGMANVEGGFQFQTNAYIDNATSAEIYNYNNLRPIFGYVMTFGDYHNFANDQLWANAGDRNAETNGIIFSYNASDALPGINATHGRRTYLGYHMNGTYANASNGGFQPAPLSADFDPARHLTTIGKLKFDEALVSAGADCAICTPRANLFSASATCSAGVPNNDGYIDIISLVDANKIGISTANAASYNGPSYSALSNASTPFRIVNNIPNTGASYYIRVFNGSATCFYDMLVTIPTVFCSAPCPDPLLALPCYVFGSYQGNSMDAFVSLRPNPELPITQNSFNMNQVTHLATHAQVGCLYGTTYVSSNNSIYSAAYIKRHSALGVGGTGAIYKIDPLNVLPPTVFVDLNAIFGANTAGANPHPYGPSDQCPAAGGGTSHFACWYNDVNAWDAVGRQGLGDLDASADGAYLYVVNMTNKSVYQIPTTNPTAANIKVFPFPTTLPGVIAPCGDPIQVRPMGLGVRGGLVYVGALCTEEVSIPYGGSYGGDRIYIYALDPVSGTWVKSLEGSIQKGGTNNRCFGWPSAYRDSYADGRNMLLSDIDFDNSGQMLIGIRDISGDRYGSETGRPIPADGSSSFYSSGGDILKACKNTSTGLYELEINGVCGGVTSTGPLSGEGLGPSATAREYFHGEAMLPAGVPDEISLGSVAYNPANNHVYVSAYDITGVYQQGLISLNNATGVRTASYVILANTTGPGQFGKTNGFGDLDLVNCCVMDISARDSAVCSGIGVNLAILTENLDGGFGAYSYFSTLANAQNNQNPLASGVVSPTVTTKYYVRKAIIPSCFDIDSVLVQVYQPIALNVAAVAGIVCVDGSAVLTANTTNLTPDCTLQWQLFNGTTWSDVLGAVGATYTTPPLSSNKSYRVRATCTANQCADDCPIPGGG